MVVKLHVHNLQLQVKNGREKNQIWREFQFPMQISGCHWTDFEVLYGNLKSPTNFHLSLQIAFAHAT